MQYVWAQLMLGGLHGVRTQDGPIDGTGSGEWVGASFDIGAYHMANHHELTGPI
jgi:hypothetical protein